MHGGARRREVPGRAGIARPSIFPDPGGADAHGLLASGGDLSPETLLDAYSHGIFPWFDSDAEPLLWWSPDPRAVLPPDAMHVSRRLARRLRSGVFRFTADSAFEAVMAGCAAPRQGRPGTWITPAMVAAYTELHERGYAHSVEVWRGGELAGGIYGVSLGRMFFGESMFSAATDASKAALATLARHLDDWRFTLIDCQIMNDHLRTLGVRNMPRRRFLELVAANRRQATRRGPWRLCREEVNSQ